MLYVDECVRSRLHGLGLVTDGGERPLVRLLCGRELRIDENDLQVIPDHEYDAEVHNRYMIERWLTTRITRLPDTRPDLMPRIVADLAERMAQSAHTVGLTLQSPIIDYSSMNALT